MTSANDGMRPLARLQRGTDLEPARKSARPPRLRDRVFCKDEWHLTPTNLNRHVQRPLVARKADIRRNGDVRKVRKGDIAPATSELSAQGSGAPSAVGHLVHERSK